MNKDEVISLDSGNYSTVGYGSFNESVTFRLDESRFSPNSAFVFKDFFEVRKIRDDDGFYFLFNSLSLNGKAACEISINAQISFNNHKFDLATKVRCCSGDSLPIIIGRTADAVNAMVKPYGNSVSLVREDGLGPDGECIGFSVKSRKPENAADFQFMEDNAHHRGSMFLELKIFSIQEVVL